MKKITLKQTINVGLFVALAVTMGQFVISIPGFSVGEWMTKLAPFLFFGILLFFHQIDALPIKWEIWKSIFGQTAKKDLDFKWVLILILLAVLISFALVNYNFGLTMTLAVFLTVVGIIISGILIASDKQALGLSLLIITLSIVHFLEYQIRYLDIYSKAECGILYILPSIIILWIMAFEFFYVHLTKRKSFAGTPFNKVWLFIFIPMLLSAAFSDDYILSFRNVFYFFSVSIPFFLVVNSVKSIEELKLCILSLVVASGIRVSTLLYFEMGKMSSGFEYSSTEYSNFSGYTSILSLGITFVFFLSLALAFEGRFKPKKIFIITGIVVLLLVTLFKLPRNTVIALFCGMPVLLLFRKIKIWVIIGLFASILTVYLSFDWIIGNTALGRFKEIASVDLLMINQKARIDSYRVALSLMKDFPFGIGPGMWDAYYYKYAKDPAIYNVNGVPHMEYVSFAHNLFLQQGAICGILGLISMIVLAYMMMKNSIVLLRSQCDGFMKRLSVAFVSITIVFWIMSSIGGYSFEISRSPETHYWFWFFVGLIAAAMNIHKQKKHL